MRTTSPNTLEPVTSLWNLASGDIDCIIQRGTGQTGAGVVPKHRDKLRFFTTHVLLTAFYCGTDSRAAEGRPYRFRFTALCGDLLCSRWHDARVHFEFIYLFSYIRLPYVSLLWTCGRHWMERPFHDLFAGVVICRRLCLLSLFLGMRKCISRAYFFIGCTIKQSCTVNELIKQTDDCHLSLQNKLDRFLQHSNHGTGWSFTVAMSSLSVRRSESRYFASYMVSRLSVTTDY